MLMKIDFSGEANIIAHRLSDFVLYFAHLYGSQRVNHKNHDERQTAEAYASISTLANKLSIACKAQKVFSN